MDINLTEQLRTGDTPENITAPSLDLTLESIMMLQQNTVPPNTPGSRLAGFMMTAGLIIAGMVKCGLTVEPFLDICAKCNTIDSKDCGRACYLELERQKTGVKDIASWCAWFSHEVLRGALSRDIADSTKVQIEILLDEVRNKSRDLGQQASTLQRIRSLVPTPFQIMIDHQIIRRQW